MRYNRRKKKSGHPTQPGNRSTASGYIRTKEYAPILYHVPRFFKRVRWGRVTILVLSTLGAFYLITLVLGAFAEQPEEQPTTTKVEYIFKTGDGHPIDVRSMASTWAAEAGMTKRYDLTDAERWEIASVVTAEANGEPYAGKVAVAQCILQACEDDKIRPMDAVVKYQYTKRRPEPTEEALKAVQAVFDLGQVVTDEPIKYFYAPARVESKWHESQDYVMTINGHKFFAERSK